MTAKLYALPGSHPCAAVEAALELKSIPFKRIELLPMSQLVIGPLRWGGNTVPGMRMNGERLVGSRAILRRLDELVPEPALLPSDPDARERVLEAERWGDEVLQGVPRRIIDAAFMFKPTEMLSYAADSKLPIPDVLIRPSLPLTARLMARKNDAGEANARADLSALPGYLDRIDGWIDAGVLGGDQPNAADLQIGSSIRLLVTIGDARPLIAGRPCERLTRYFSPMVGEVAPGTLPADWLPAPVAV
ncbi:MAG TPA: glutathione S-transferase family protein [Solirubrobacteraceae bacterium]|nr:glutathione S-transferase family protein [Solirubrobacteraceae bacterium]